MGEHDVGIETINEGRISYLGEKMCVFGTSHRLSRNGHSGAPLCPRKKEHLKHISGGTTKKPQRSKRAIGEAKLCQPIRT